MYSYVNDSCYVFIVTMPTNHNHKHMTGDELIGDEVDVYHNNS